MNTRLNSMLFAIFLFVLMVWNNVGATAAAEPELVFSVKLQNRPLPAQAERELKGCFEFLWNEYVDDPELPTFGMTNGNGLGVGAIHPISIEGQGFYFASIVIGVERNWITREAGYKRCVDALTSIKGLKNFRGHYYHFIDRESGLRGWRDSKNIEVTNMGTATMIAGAIVAGEYFGGRVAELAEELYRRIDWKWFQDPKLKHFYLACHPEDVPSHVKTNEEGFFGHWGAYSEHLLMYILGAGAPVAAHATGPDAYYRMMTRKGSYKGAEFIYCVTGSAFTYQWTHCFVDFRAMEDRLGRNWFENSRRAAVAARQFAIDQSEQVKGLGPNSWGLTASRSPTTTYSGRYGSLPAGSGSDVGRLLMDGTVAPYGAIGFIVFSPKRSIEALEYMYTIPGLTGRYGLYDAYSFHTKADGDRPWVARTYLDIDKGLEAMMLENYSSQLIWRLFHRNRHVQAGLRKLDFQPTQIR